MKFEDKNGLILQDGDVFDIHQTVNGRSLFYVDSIEPLDIRYEYDRKRKYEYNEQQLLAPCIFTGESQFTIVSRDQK